MEKFTESELVNIIGDSVSAIRRDGAQAELLRRQIVELRRFNEQAEKSNKSNERFSKILFLVAFLQLIVAVFQLLAPFFVDTRNAWKGLVVEIILFVMMFYFLYDSEFFPKKKK